MLAIYSLLLFWRAFARELEPFAAGLKLFCVKGVVFFAWWQSLGVAIAVNAGWVQVPWCKRHTLTQSSCFDVFTF
jgi:hypothetical protein